MAVISLDVPNVIGDAIAARFGYDSQVDGTKAQFMKKRVAQWLKEQAREHVVNTAASTAAHTAADSVNSLEIT